MLTRPDLMHHHPHTVSRRMVVACVLLMMFFMQFSMLKHGLEHFGVQSRQVADMRVTGSFVSPESKLVSTDASQPSELPFSTTCFKCLEDQAHALALPSAVNTSQIVPADTQAWIGLRFSLIFLSPERANQRGPPTLS